MQETPFVHQLRETAPGLPPFQGDPLAWVGAIIIITSIPTQGLDKDGNIVEGLGGQGATTTTDQIASFAQHLHIPIAPVIHLGDRFRAAFKQLEATLKSSSSSQEGRLVDALPELQKRIGRLEDEKAIEEAIAAARMGLLVLYESKFGAQLAGEFALLAPMIPIRILGIDCAHDTANVRKASIMSEEEGREITPKVAEKKRIQRVPQDDATLVELYSEKFPGVRFSRQSQLDKVTHVADTTETSVEESAWAVLSWLIETIPGLEKELQQQAPFKYNLYKTLKEMGLNRLIGSVTNMRHEALRILRDIFPNLLKHTPTIAD